MKSYQSPKIQILHDLNLLLARTQTPSSGNPGPGSAPENGEFFDCQNYFSCPVGTNMLTFDILWQDTDNLNQPDGFNVNVYIEGTFGVSQYGRPLTLPSGNAGCSVTYNGADPLPYKLSCEINLGDIIDGWICPNSIGDYIEVTLNSIEDPDGNIYQAQDTSCSCITGECETE